MQDRILNLEGNLGHIIYALIFTREKHDSDIWSDMPIFPDEKNQSCSCSPINEYIYIHMYVYILNICIYFEYIWIYVLFYYIYTCIYISKYTKIFNIYLNVYLFSLNKSNTCLF